MSKTTNSPAEAISRTLDEVCQAVDKRDWEDALAWTRKLQGQLEVRLEQAHCGHRWHKLAPNIRQPRFCPDCGKEATE